ncbi:MAG: IS200/IS605 family element transposase accessory protein TnpB [Firmicutes bacterium]|nr:IS200/IS605 family element transposase accessory protein TnpB [Bacillota bacterium]
MAGEIAKEIINYLLKEDVGAIVVEDLKFRKDHDTYKKFNRLTHCFTYKKILDCLIRSGFLVKKVNPAYTSIIGRFKYTKHFGLSVHESASLVIGRRGLGFNEKIPKKLIRIIENFKTTHKWSLWNVVNKTLLLKEYKFVIKF